MANVALTKTEAAYLSIRSAIQTGDLPQGSRLIVSTLQRRFQISPTPIREALRMLQSDGLVTGEAHLGMTVTSYEQSDVEEVYRIREMLEPLAAGSASQKRSEEDLTKLLRIHDDLASAVHDGMHARAAELNGEWHALIIEMSGLRLVNEFLTRLQVVLPLKAMWRASSADLSVGEHSGINLAIASRDVEQAVNLMGLHVARGARMAVTSFVENLGS